MIKEINPLVIDLQSVGADGVQLVTDVPAEILELNEKSTRLTGAIHCDFFVQLTEQELLVSGSWTVPVELECVRCAEFFSTSFEDLSFLRDYTVSDETVSVDITEGIREDVLLRIPHFPVCSEHCQGLCPQCGKNRNLEMCSCEEPEANMAWGVLDQLDS